MNHQFCVGLSYTKVRSFLHSLHCIASYCCFDGVWFVIVLLCVRCFGMGETSAVRP